MCPGQGEAGLLHDVSGLLVTGGEEEVRGTLLQQRANYFSERIVLVLVIVFVCVCVLLN